MNIYELMQEYLAQPERNEHTDSYISHFISDVAWLASRYKKQDSVEVIVSLQHLAALTRDDSTLPTTLAELEILGMD